MRRPDVWGLGRNILAACTSAAAQLEKGAVGGWCYHCHSMLHRNASVNPPNGGLTCVKEYARKIVF